MEFAANIKKGWISFKQKGMIQVGVLSHCIINTIGKTDGKDDKKRVVF